MSQLDAELAKAAKGGKGAAALAALFSRLSEPLAAASKKMAALGIRVSEVNGTLRPVADVINDLSSATLAMDASQQAGLINSLFDKDDVEMVAALLQKASTNVLDAEINQASSSGWWIVLPNKWVRQH